jgi:hypothetical protein
MFNSFIRPTDVTGHVGQCVRRGAASQLLIDAPSARPSPEYQANQGVLTILYPCYQILMTRIRCQPIADTIRQASLSLVHQRRELIQ